jgi:plasmid stabilization system protein ParE
VARGIRRGLGMTLAGAHRTVLDPEAEIDIENAARWYEQERRGLGIDFVLAVQACLDAIEAAPLSFQKVHGEVRRWFLARFPYSVYFEVVGDQIEILAVFHGKQDEHAFKASGRQGGARNPRT